MITRWKDRKQYTAISTLGDSKPCSSIEKCLATEAQSLSKPSSSIQLLCFGRFEAPTSKVLRLNKVQNSSEHRLIVCCSTGGFKENFATNKCKVMMISLEMSFAPTSNVRKHLSQIHWARQSLIPLVKPLVFSPLSFTSPTLHSVVSI